MNKQLRSIKTILETRGWVHGNRLYPDQAKQIEEEWQKESETYCQDNTKIIRFVDDRWTVVDRLAS